MRLCGDEFAVLSRPLAGAEDAAAIALRVIKVLDRPITVGSVKYQIGVGNGVALIPQDGQDAAELLNASFVSLNMLAR